MTGWHPCPGTRLLVCLPMGSVESGGVKIKENNPHSSAGRRCLVLSVVVVVVVVGEVMTHKGKQ